MDKDSNEPMSEGISRLTKDRFEIASKTVAILGGLVSAIILILTVQESTKQRASELRWNQAKLATELLDNTLNDTKAFNALNMIDWENKGYQVGNDFVMINSGKVVNALNVENNSNLSPNGVFIRESFDRLSYHLGKLERSLESDLILFKDVTSPMDYYVPFILSKYGKVIIPYMEQLHHDDALKFMNRF
jgi:hypothetical protein